MHVVNGPLNVRLVSQVSGLPNPELMWLVNGRPIYPDLYHRMLVRENGVHSLVIDPLTQNDAGTYTCIASNKAGQSSFSLELRVVGEDPDVFRCFPRTKENKRSRDQSLWRFPVM